MPPDSPQQQKIEKLLRDFLENDQRARSRGLTLETLHDKVDKTYRAAQRLATARLEDRARLDRFGRRLRRVESQLSLVSAQPNVPVPDWHAEPEEITGTHEFRTLQARQSEIEEQLLHETERRQDSMMWWKRKRVEWIVGALGAVALLVVSAVVGTIGWFLAQALSHGGK